MNRFAQYIGIVLHPARTLDHLVAYRKGMVDNFHTVMKLMNENDELRELLDNYENRVMSRKGDEHDHCESCGIRIPLLPEDASADERLCDRCLENKEKKSNDRDTV